ncbi:MAG: hypothetical protein ACTHVE_03225 [Senegalia sp. (in: firmicutes)]|uniref:hypothetical protein n=1 Tax=Senegalia sp. (in: firmicutes) TaxID=1924098 RepID=UPI003F9DBECD
MSENNPTSQKLLNYTPDDIKSYLNKFRKCIIEKRYSIAKKVNRKENMDFIEDYKIDTKKEQEILLALQFDDFCYAVKNNNRDFPHEVLYIFCKQHELDFWGTLENVDIY